MNNQIVSNTSKTVFITTCLVTDYGCIEPVFDLTPQEFVGYTGGYLKYFSTFKGKRVKVTIEILD